MRSDDERRHPHDLRPEAAGHLRFILTTGPETVGGRALRRADQLRPPGEKPGREQQPTAPHPEPAVMFLALLFLALALPLVLRLLRALFLLHLWAVVLFLPAGVLLRLAGNEDTAVFAIVTIAWGSLLAGASASDGQHLGHHALTSAPDFQGPSRMDPHLRRTMTMWRGRRGQAPPPPSQR